MYSIYISKLSNKDALLDEVEHQSYDHDYMGAMESLKLVCILYGVPMETIIENLIAWIDDTPDDPSDFGFNEYYDQSHP